MQLTPEKKRQLVGAALLYGLTFFFYPAVAAFLFPLLIIVVIRTFSGTRRGEGDPADWWKSNSKE